MSDNYTIACNEVCEILKYLPSEYLSKIPIDLIKKLEGNREENYKFRYNVNKPYEEQEILDETKAILAKIYIDYLATEETRVKIKEFHNIARAEAELLKQQKCTSKDLFENRKLKSQYNDKNIQLIEIPKENFIKRIINKIKKLLGFRKIK